MSRSNHEYFTQFLTILMSAISIMTVAGCATAGAETEGQGNTYGEIATKLGVPMVSGFNSWSPNGDVNGEVGHPLSITGPRGGNGCNGGWNADTDIASGQLPPGLTMQNSGDISGIPTQRGHWIVTMKFANIRCNGHHFALNGAPDVFVEHQGWKDWDKCVEGGVGYCNLTTIRFHITGSGQVVQ